MVPQNRLPDRTNPHEPAVLHTWHELVTDRLKTRQNEETLPVYGFNPLKPAETRPEKKMEVAAAANKMTWDGVAEVSWAAEEARGLQEAAA